MKTTITFLFLNAALFTMSQVGLVNLEHNNVRTMLMSNGALGYDPFTGQAAYEVPKGSGKNALYMVSPIFTAELASGQLIGNHSNFSLNSGGFNGPVVNDYSDPWHTQHSVFFHMHDSVVNNHISNWASSGYIPSQKVANWPAYGNSSLNSSPYMVPFYDVNADNVYSPMDGDYPLHFGEESYSSVYNYDSIVTPNILNPETQAIEVNYSAYQVNSDELENVTFIMYRVTNKSNETLINFQWGLFSDFDLGNPNDDFIGTNVSKNLYYAYNSTNTDQSSGGAIGYGVNPPAVGIVSLSEELYATNKITDGGSHDVDFLSQLRFNMTGRGSNGSINLDSQGNPTFFMYSGDPNALGSESQHQLGETGTDQQGTMSVQPIDLAPGETKCYHFAIVFADSQTSHLESVTELFQVADAAQAYYNDSISYDCSMVMTSGVASIEDQEPADLILFPNPTNGDFYISANKRINSVAIYAMDGRNYTPVLNEKQNNEYAIDMSGLSKGVYSVQVLFGNGEILNRKLVKQ
ncbi:T9SS type A sorting domain-containing protein [Brumimicrobium mesophilum]|uniref:T9SS type A sorting domain-containing protein n=1 Tax=Brumimicrobium mesophilum TaxID=392717 RepID=UPI000D13FF08|nr:T9SS type A sorting domain-containing protein [Brumimicrobium mesophilum]